MKIYRLNLMRHWINFRQISILMIFFHLILAGCSHIKQHQQQSVEIAQGITLTLMSPAALGISQVLTQSVTIKHAGEEHNTLAQIEIDNHSLVLVGMTPLGNQLFSIEYRKNNWYYEVNPILSARIKPKYLLADFQLSYWPIELLQQHLSGGTIQLEKTLGAANKRAIYRDSKKIIDIRYEKSGLWKGQVDFRHLERDYSVSAKTLSVEEL
jgi:hypothetical protein